MYNYQIVLNTLEEAISNKNWDKVVEAYQLLADMNEESPFGEYQKDEDRFEGWE